MLERDTNLQAAPEADAAGSDEQVPDAAALKGKRKAVVGAPRGAAEAEGPASATPAKKAKLGELRSSTAEQRSRMLMRRLVTSGQVESQHASAQDQEPRDAQGHQAHAEAEGARPLEAHVHADG